MKNGTWLPAPQEPGEAPPLAASAAALAAYLDITYIDIKIYRYIICATFIYYGQLLHICI